MYLIDERPVSVFSNKILLYYTIGSHWLQFCLITFTAVLKDIYQFQCLTASMLLYMQ